MATKAAPKVNKFFVLYAAEHIEEIDEDKHGLFCRVMSETEENKTYKVYLDEETAVPNPFHCNCEAFTYDNTRACKHQQAAGRYFWNLHNKNVKKVEAPVDAGSRGNLGGTKEFSVLR